MLVAGIDVSTHVIAVAFVELRSGRLDSLHTFSIDEKKSNAVRRAMLVRKVMPGADFWADVHTIGIEDPWGRGIQSTMSLYRVQGAVIACLPELPVETWNPTGWKAAIGVGGAADKENIMRFIKMLEPGFEGTQDEADALGVAIATRGVALLSELGR